VIRPPWGGDVSEGEESTFTREAARLVFDGWEWESRSRRPPGAKGGRWS